MSGRAARDLRVAVFTDAVYRRDGSDTYADETFSLFAARLHDHVGRVVLVGRVAPDSSPAANRLPDDVAVVALPHHEGLLSPQALGAMAASVRTFWRVLDGVDAVWLLGPHPLAIVFAVQALVRRRRVVLGVRQDLPAYVRHRHPGRRGLLAAAAVLEGTWRLLARGSAVVAVGDGLARAYAHAPKTVPITVSLVEDADIAGPDLAAAQKAPADARSAEGLVVLSVGRLDPEKNPLLLADVLELLRAELPSVRLVVCGDGSLAGELQRRLCARGLASSARLLGALPLDRLTEHYRAADVLLHVSLTEGFPQVLLEAFAAGTPVVATDVGAVAAVASGAAVLVPPADARAAADGVLQVARDASLRSALVARGAEVARAHTGARERERVVDLLAS